MGDGGTVIGKLASGASAPLKRTAQEGQHVKATEILHERGQSIWLDNITRAMLDSGKIQRYIDSYSVTGLTSNPSIFDKAIGSGDYDESIAAKAAAGLSGEDLFFELAIEDLRRAADEFLGIHERTDGVDGWVSLEVSPLLARDTAKTVEAAKMLHAKAGRTNLFIKIPGTPAGPAGDHRVHRRGRARSTSRCCSPPSSTWPPRTLTSAAWSAGSRPASTRRSPSVASVFMSRWDVAVTGKVPAELNDRLGLAVGQATYRAYRQLMDSDRALRLENAGVRMQRLLWASTGTKDPDAPDTLYVHGLAAPFTINTMPDKTLEAFADHGEVGEAMPADGGDCDEVLAKFADAGIDAQALATKLQDDGADAFVDAWTDLLDVISSHSESLT